ncbi:MAG: hypothetical protein ACRCT1_04525, partial [Microcoleaceae cyanobacterium]
FRLFQVSRQPRGGNHGGIAPTDNETTVGAGSPQSFLPTNNLDKPAPERDRVGMGRVYVILGWVSQNSANPPLPNLHFW